MTSRRWEMQLRLEKVKAMEPTLCPKCKKDTLEKFAMGRAWYCTSCGESNEEYRRICDSIKDLPQSKFYSSPEFREAMEKCEAKFNAKLKAAGLVPTSDPDFWTRLHAFVRFDLKLTLEEFGSMTEADLDAFLDRYLRSKSIMDKQEPQPEELSRPEPISLRKDARTAEEGAADAAWADLGSEASYREVGDWIDQNRKTPCHYAPRGSTSWKSVLARPSDDAQRKACEAFLRRRKQKKWPVQ